MLSEDHCRSWTRIRTTLLQVVDGYEGTSLSSSSWLTYISRFLQDCWSVNATTSYMLLTSWLVVSVCGSQVSLCCGSALLCTWALTWSCSSCLTLICREAVMRIRREMKSKPHHMLCACRGTVWFHQTHNFTQTEPLASHPCLCVYMCGHVRTMKILLLQLCLFIYKPVSNNVVLLENVSEDSQQTPVLCGVSITAAADQSRVCWLVFTSGPEKVKVFLDLLYLRLCLCVLEFRQQQTTFSDVIWVFNAELPPTPRSFSQISPWMMTSY